ncbi:VanW family protein [Planococcus liqunii]|uniref:VanW family protein n=1 Tax=Planococcus liqunii TaxID=3058394 RepID=UPI00263049E8|nr:VanW family protein [Planococcus sp. N056]WKA52442.1 VanW family protein [Planococcus sp. N056]
MNNKVFGITFALVLASALLFFGVANAGAMAVDTWIFPTEEFEDNTYIGTTDVSNLEHEQAKQLFVGQVDSWRTSSELLVTYQDATASYPLENAEILLDETIAQAQSGTQNNFVFQLQPETTQTFLAQQFPSALFSEADIENITNKLETALADGQTQTRVAISDDTLEVPREIVSEATITHTLKDGEAMAVVNALNGLELAPASQFSFLDFVNALKLANITDAELTEIASSIYSAVLKTNFSVDERSIGAEAPAAVPLGQEAAINRTLGIDFVFTNTNNSSFTLNLSMDNGSLTAMLTGYPLNYEYEILASGEQKIKPRLVKQYSAFVTKGSTIGEKGREGVRINVLRSVREDGKELKVDAVSTDFYPPVHRIEIYPLIKTETAPATGTTVPQPGQPGFIDANGDGVHDVPATPATPLPGQPGFVDANGDGVHDAPVTTPVTPQPGQPGFTDANGDGVHDMPVPTPTTPLPGQPGYTDSNGDGVHDTPAAGSETDDQQNDTPANTDKEKDPVYDKSGKLVNP